jgi:hypothetical protein
MSRRKKQQAVFMQVFKNDKGEETYSQFNLKVVDKTTEDGKTIKSLEKVTNEFIKTIPYNRKARRMTKKIYGKSNRT